MIIAIVVAVVLFALDLLTKYLICDITRNSDTIVVIRNVLSLTYSENTGASFGMFGEHPVLLMVFTTAVIAGMIVYLAIFHRKMHKLAYWSLLIVVAGALGNLFDRYAFGYVRDFINFDFISIIIGRTYPVCNFADVVLVAGTIMLLVYVIFYYNDHYLATHPEEAAKEAERKAQRQKAQLESASATVDTNTVSILTDTSSETAISNEVEVQVVDDAARNAEKDNAVLDKGDNSTGVAQDTESDTSDGKQ